MKDKDVAFEEGDAGRELEMERIDDKLYFIRLNISERVQHGFFVASFIVLVITGFMLKIPEDIVNKLGEAGKTIFYYRGISHRTAGIIMILVSIYHMYYLILTSAGRRWLVDMLPKLKDLTDMIRNIRYYLGLRDTPPEFDRFCYKHKLEYLALFAGTSLMAITGLLMWAESFWSKFILDLSTIVHGMEAILACLAIIVWHLYEVHLRPHKFPIDNMWITGVIDEEEMKEEFPLHYKKIMDEPELKKIYIKK
ncbi:MAG: cytochrome b/b6 domain-containing protein [Desulfobacterales bacterium]